MHTFISLATFQRIGNMHCITHADVTFQMRVNETRGCCCCAQFAIRSTTGTRVVLLGCITIIMAGKFPSTQSTIARTMRAVAARDVTNLVVFLPLLHGALELFL